MSSKKSSPNNKAAPEGSVGRHGNRWTNGIALALSGLAAVVSVVALIKVQEIASMQDQQTAFQTDLQGLRDQVLLMQLKQEKREAKDKLAQLKTGDVMTAPPFGKVRRCTTDPRGTQRPTLYSSLENVQSIYCIDFFGCLSGPPTQTAPTTTTPAVKGFTVWARSFASKDPGYPNTTDKYDRSYISINGQASSMY
ncbi:PREDICTED: uncharacterized protein LOC109468446 [Branchiostoma belcheri]|uniref:Uncharacterized protein LOC109468446 n=1 Tax=Branchiostoma belcheri TaxID=7741 RepID=A0A6P4Y035_BRABE|nr:PREDICTED: uncharacterized protein LOC109468446 [Branchiostoma belcheri]